MLIMLFLLSRLSQMHRCRYIRSQQIEVRPKTSSPPFLHPLLKSLYRSLHQTICNWVVRCRGNVLDAINCKNDLNSLHTKLEPLLDTTISGKPYEAKVDLILSMVTSEVAEFTQWISIHLEWTSMINKNIFLIKGPT